MRHLNPALALALVLALLLGACGDDDQAAGPSPAQELAAARSVWEAHGLDGYRFVVTGWNMGGDFPRFVVTVNGDQITSEALDPPTHNYQGTTWDGDLDDLFDRVQETLDEHADDPGWLPEYLLVDYHPTWGFPVLIRERDGRAIDGGWGVSVKGFAPGREPLTIAALPQVQPDDITDPTSGLSDDRSRRALTIALTDPQIQETLVYQGYQVDRITEPAADSDGAVAIVEAELDRPVAPGHLPADRCQGLTQSRIYRIRWIVNLDQETIAEVCGY